VHIQEQKLTPKGTTIIAVRCNKKVAIAGDGQVTLGDTILKQKARKVRKLYKDRVIAGFAGTTADALTLFEKFEKKLDEYSGNLTRSAVELAKEWRTDKILRRLEALLVIADKEKSLIVSGTGDVIEPDEGIIAVGSGGPYALAAAKALLKFTNFSAVDIAKEALNIASSICIYTNNNFVIEDL